MKKHITNNVLCFFIFYIIGLFYNQKIHCSVGSCKYNDVTVQECKLKAINVMPNTNVNTGTEKETMCVSYKKDQ